MQRSWFTRRSLVAAILAMVYPGLGHVYLRAWFRAIAWFGVALIAAAMVLPESAYTAFETDGFSGLVAVSRTLPTEAVLSMLVVRVLNAVDAYLTGLQQQATAVAQTEDTDASACPECGKELDPELDFCPWCTTRLEDAENRSEQ
ncbi:MAG: DUF7575 domain-containing protein [Halobacteriota archaeon]